MIALLVALLAAAIAAELFPTEIAISGENGGGGNRTRVTCPTENGLSSVNASGASDDDSRPPLVTRGAPTSNSGRERPRPRNQRKERRPEMDTAHPRHRSNLDRSSSRVRAADVACREAVASRPGLALAGVLHPSARISGLVAGRHRLDWRSVPVLRRYAVPRVHLGVGWRVWFAVVVVCAGAAVSCVGYVVAERPVVVAVGDSGDLWAPVSTDASWGT